MSGTILLVTGSVRPGSYTRTLVEAVGSALEDRGLETAHWTLGDRSLPIADPAWHAMPEDHPDPVVREWAATATDCRGFVLGSPIYHNGYSGALKNALDHLSIRHFTYKPVGLVGHGGGRSPQAVDHLRIVTRGLSGIAIPTQVCTSPEDYGPGPVLTNPDILARIERFSVELLMYVTLFYRFQA